MSDAPLPFRPNSESAADRAVEQIELQTRGFRLRSNRFAVADGAFVSAGIVFLAGASLILLAFRLSPRGFAIAAWLILAAVVAVVARKLARARRAWLPRANAPVVIDERARLEERLATLAATTEASRRSRLWEFLLHENLRLLPAWEPERFVPRALPRSAWFCVIALVVLLGVQHRIPRGTNSEANSPDEIAASGPPAAGESDATGEDGSEPGSQQPSFGWTNLPEALRQAIVGSQSSQSFTGKIPEKTAPVKEDRGGPALYGERMANGGPVRSMPAGPNVPRPAGPPGAGANVPPAPGAKGLPGGEPPPVPPQARGDAPKMLPPAQSGKPRGPADKSTGKTGTGGSGGAGAGSGGDAEGLYGDKQATGKGSGSFALDLDAMRASDPNATGDSGDPDARPEARLAPDQRLDDAIRRAQVPVEYEKVVQRIFNRTSGEETPP